MSIVSRRLRVQFGFSPADIGMIFGAFSLSYALFQTPWGIVADRRSARNIVAVVVLMWSVFTGLTALSTSLAAFLVVRFFSAYPKPLYRPPSLLFSVASCPLGSGLPTLAFFSRAAASGA